MRIQIVNNFVDKVVSNCVSYYFNVSLSQQKQINKMGKYSDKEIELNNGEKVMVQVNKNYEDGSDYYKTKGHPYAFESLEKVAEHLNDKIIELQNLITTPQYLGNEENKKDDFEIDYSLSEDNNSLDDSEYDTNGNDTNGHYDSDGDYWAPGHSEIDCS